MRSTVRSDTGNLGVSGASRSWAEAAANPWAPLLSGVHAWNGTVSSSVAAYGEEWFEFMKRRIHEDLVLSQRLAGCRGPDELAQEYLHFWQKAVADYQKEFTELARIGGALVAPNTKSEPEDAEGRESGSKRGYDPGSGPEGPSAPREWQA